MVTAVVRSGLQESPPTCRYSTGEPRMGRGRVVGTLAMLAALAALAGGVAAAAARLDRPDRWRDAADELVYLPDADHLRPLGLGWDTVLADVLWFRTISYFGRHYQTDRAYPWLARMCDLVTDLDPRAEHVYRFGGLILPWEGDEVDAGIRLLEKGTRALPDAWQLRYQLGILRYLFKDDAAGAADDLRVAALLPGAPPTLGGIAAGLAARSHTPETRVAFLRDLLERTESEAARAILVERLRDAQFALDAGRLTALVDRYRQRTGSPPASLDTLVVAGLLRAVPPDPFGGRYSIDPHTGAVVSTTGRTPREHGDSPGRRARRAAAASPTE
jgi:hypothetical protein